MQSFKEDIQMATRYVRRFSTSLITRKCNSKPQREIHLTPFRMAVFKYLRNNTMFCCVECAPMYNMHLCFGAHDTQDHYTHGMYSLCPCIMCILIFPSKIWAKSAHYTWQNAVNDGEDVEKWEPLHTIGRSVSCLQLLWKTIWKKTIFFKYQKYNWHSIQQFHF